MFELEIEVYWNSPEQTELQKLGLEDKEEASIEVCEIRIITLYSVTGVIEFREDGKIYGALLVGGEGTYVTPYSCKELKQKVREAYNK